MRQLPVALAALLLGVLSHSPAGAQTPQAETAAGDTAARVTDARITDAPAVATFDPDSATTAYLARVPAERRALIDAYAVGGYWIALWSSVITIVLMALLLHLGWSRRMRDRVERLSRWRAVQTLAYFAAFYLAIMLVTAPWWAFAGYFRERRYGFMNQSFAEWLGDYVQAFAIDLVLVGIAVVGFYWIVRRLPRTWPLWGAVAAVAFVAVQLFIYPLYIAPRFNTFTPLGDAWVREPILSMARANGLDVQEVWVMDESRRSSRINAHVAGLFGTERMIMNDNLLDRSTLPEIRTAMAHEIGHFVLNHRTEQLFRSVVFIAIAFLLLRWGYERATRRWGERWGVRGIGDVAGLPLLVLLFTLISLLGTPVANSFSRQDEGEADIFALNAAREPDGAALLLLKVGEFRKLDPTPLEEALFYSHPSPRRRIHQAMVWKSVQVRRGELP